MRQGYVACIVGMLVYVVLFCNWSGAMLSITRLHPFYRRVLEGRAHRLFQQFNQSCTHYGVEYRRVLDFGCGFGGLSEMLRRNRTNVVSVDLVDHYIYPERNLRLLRKSTTQLPFATGEFDVAVSSFCFHHIPEAKHHALVAELLRVARCLILIEEDPSRNLLCRFVNSEVFTHANAHKDLSAWKTSFDPNLRVESLCLNEHEFSIFISPRNASASKLINHFEDEA